MRLFFVGGIHGVGKTTLCRQLASVVGCQPFSAGELIHSSTAMVPTSEKVVGDVQGNQERLVAALEALRPVHSEILLDGHYCVMTSGDEIEAIPLDVFQRIRPSALLLVTADPNVVVERLAQRDERKYTLDRLAAFAFREQEHAVQVSRSLNIPLETIQGPTAVEDARKFLQTMAI